MSAIVRVMQDTLHTLQQRAEDKRHKHAVAVALKRKRDDFISDTERDAKDAEKEVALAVAAIKRMGAVPENRSIATGIDPENMTVEQLEKELFR